MITQASKNYPSIQFKVADGTDFTFSKTFHAVFSNAALHWIEPPEAVVACVWQALKPGGRFVAEFGGKGNVVTILDAINRVIQDMGYPIKEEWNPWYFPSISEYTTLLEQAGFSVIYCELFDRLTPLEGGKVGMSNWINMFAKSIRSVIPPNKHKITLQKIEDRLRDKLYKDNTWFADYKRIRVVALK